MTTTTPTIRLATTQEDRAAAYRLRYEIYVEDQNLFVAEADHERRWLTDDEDAGSRIFIAELGGQVVGTSRVTFGREAAFSRKSRRTYAVGCFAGIVDERDIAVSSRLMVRPELRGGNLGFRLLEACWAHVARNNGELVLGTCEPHLVSYYLKIGMRPFGKLDNEPTNAALVRVAAVMGDFDFHRRVESPMLPALALRTRDCRAVPAILAAMAKDRAITLEQETGFDTYWAEICRHLQGEDGRLHGALAELDRHEAGALLARSQLLQCRPGNRLFLRGHTSRTVFVLLSGSLLSRGESGTVQELSEPGMLVGETAFFSGEARLRDMLAGPHGAHVLALDGGTLRRLLAAHLAVASKFLQAVTRSLGQRLATLAPLLAARHGRHTRRHRATASRRYRRASTARGRLGVN